MIMVGADARFTLNIALRNAGVYDESLAVAEINGRSSLNHSYGFIFISYVSGPSA